MSGLFKGILKRLFRTFMGYGVFWLLVVLFFVLTSSGLISSKLFTKFLESDSALVRLTGSLTNELAQIKQDSSPALPENSPQSAAASLDSISKEELADSPSTEQYYLYQEGEYTTHSSDKIDDTALEYVKK